MPARTRIDHLLLALLSRRPVTANTLATRLGEFPLAGRGTSPGTVYPAVRRLEKAGLVEASDKPRNEPEAERRRRNGRADRRGTARRRRPRESRRHRVYRLTGDGWEAVREWARRAPGREDVRRRPDELLLRFLVLAKLDPGVEADEHGTPPAEGARHGAWVRGPKVLPAWKIVLEGALPPTRRADGGRTRAFLETYADVAQRVSEELKRDLRWKRGRPRWSHPFHWTDYDASWERRLATELLVSLFETRAAWARRAAADLGREPDATPAEPPPIPAERPPTRTAVSLPGRRTGP